MNVFAICMSTTMRTILGTRYHIKQIEPRIEKGNPRIEQDDHENRAKGIRESSKTEYENRAKIIENRPTWIQKLREIWEMGDMNPSLDRLGDWFNNRPTLIIEGILNPPSTQYTGKECSNTQGPLYFPRSRALFRYCKWGNRFGDTRGDPEKLLVGWPPQQQSSRKSRGTMHESWVMRGGTLVTGTCPQRVMSRACHGPNFPSQLMAQFPCGKSLRRLRAFFLFYFPFYICWVFARVYWTPPLPNTRTHLFFF